MRKTFFTLLLTWSVAACSTKEVTEVVSETNRTQKTPAINYDFVISPKTIKGDFRTYLQGVVTTYDKVLIKSGTYVIELVDHVGIKPKNGCTITFEKGAKIKVAPNNLRASAIFDFRGRNNITLWNPVLEGDKYEHIGTEGQWGHGIHLTDCNNITIHNPKITKFWGDGIYINNCKNTKIYNPILEDNRRQGISIISCENIEIYNPIIANTSGTSPAFGIDIEPNFNGDHVRGLKIYNATFRYNALREGEEYPAGFCLSTKGVGTLSPNKRELVPTHFDIELINPTFYGDALFILAPLDLVHGKITVKKPVFYNSREAALLFQNHQSNNFKSEIIEPTLNNCVDKDKNSIYYVPILFYCSNKATKTTGTKNITIKNPKIIADNNAKFKINAIRNITPSRFTEDMKDVIIENLIVSGYDIPFYNHSGNSDLDMTRRLSAFSNLDSKFILTLNTKESKVSKLKAGFENNKMFSGALADFRENVSNPTIYLTDDIPVSGFELYYINNSTNKVPLNLNFGTKSTPTKKTVQRSGKNQRSSNGITIPYGGHVTLIKKSANIWEIVSEKSSNNILY